MNMNIPQILIERRNNMLLSRSTGILFLVLSIMIVMVSGWSFKNVEGVYANACHSTFYSASVQVFPPHDKQLTDVNLKVTLNFERGEPRTYEIKRNYWGSSSQHPFDFVNIEVKKDNSIGNIREVILKGKCNEGRINGTFASDGYSFP